MENNQPQDPAQPAPTQPSSTLSGKTILLIVGLFVLTVALIVLALKVNKSDTPLTTQTQTTTPTPTSIAHSVLSFSPQTVTVNPATSSAQTLDIMIDSGGDQVSGIQLELSFDPAVVSLTSLTPGTFLPNALTLLPAAIDNTAGTATIIFAKTPAQQAKTGQGLAATVVYRIKPQGATTLQQTTIKILPKSLVTATGIKESVLKTTGTATINFSTQVQGAKTQQKRIIITPGQGV